MRRFTIYITGLFLLFNPFLLFAQPTAGFAINDPIPLCQPASISFINTSTSDTTVSFLWQLGLNGATDTVTNPVFTYDSCGSFLVTLIVTDATGLSDTAAAEFFIHCAPQSAFTADLFAICDSSTIHFTDNSTPADSIIAWQWNFGDPSSGSLNSSSEKNPAHLFDSGGVFIVSLIVGSSAGCSDTAYDTIMVFAPEAAFAVSDLCLNDSTHFTDLSTSTDSIVEWLWNFDDPSEGNNHSVLQNPSHIFSQAGDYDVRLTVTTLNGCVNALFQTITIHSLPVTNAGPDQAMCSGDSVQLQASGASTYEWTPQLFLTNPSIPDPIAFPSSTMEFFVTGTDTNGCKATDSVTINVLSADVNAGNDTVICAGTIATLHATGGLTFHWLPSINISNDSVSSPEVFPDTTTTYSVTVTNADGCTGTDSVTVVVSPLPLPAIIGLSDHYCVNGPPVELAATPLGGIFSGDGVSGNVFNPSSLASDSSYPVIYIYTDSIGCTGSDTAVVSISPAPEIFISATDSSICLNATPVEISAIPLGGVLSGPGISNNLFDPSITGGPGIYTVFYSITDSSGCSNTDSLMLTVLSLPATDAGADTVICAGDSVQLQASGGINYVWLPDSTLSDGQVQNPIAFPMVTTQYIVVASDDNGCANSDSILVTVFYPLNADAGPDVGFCRGDTAMLQASGGTDYLWSPSAGLSDPTIANPLAFPQQTTTYTVTINAGTPCPAIDSVLVTPHSLPVINASGDSSFCKGDSVPLSATGGESYLWQPSSSLTNNSISDPIAFPEISTTYFVTGTDSNECSATDSVFLNVIPLPVVDAGIDTSVCSGDSIQLNAMGAITYSWMPPDSLTADSVPDPIAFPAVSTMYFVTGTDSSGCSNIDSIQVVVVTQSLVDAGPDTVICRGDSIMLQASGGLSYSWSPSLGLSDPSVANPFASPPVTTIYVVTVTVGITCTFSDSVKITVHDLPIVNAGEDSSVCPSDSIQLLATGALAFQWLPVNSLSNPQIPDPFAFPASTTIYSVTGTDAFGCQNTDSVSISVLTAPVANAGADTAICIGDSAMLHASGGNSFAWSPASSLSNSLIADPIAFPAVTTLYIVKVNDGGICFGYDTVVVVVNPLPLAAAGDDQLACYGNPIQLNASGGTDYLWTPVTGLSNSAINNPVATVTGSITYVVSVTDQNLCSATDSIHIELQPPLIASVSNDTAICKGMSAQLIAGGGQIYSWLPAALVNDPNSASVTTSPEATTEFSVVVSDGICYSDTLEVSVFVSSPFVNAGEDAILTAENLQLNATASPGVYDWNPADGMSCVNCLDPLATPIQTTTYTITVTDSIGCKASDDITISVGCSEDDVFIPNAFTPDNNGHNDLFLIRTNGDFQLSYFRIFDRWGKIIFESNDIHDGWNGTFKNKPLSPGVYLYLMEGKCGNDNLIRRHGNVTLLK